MIEAHDFFEFFAAAFMTSCIVLIITSCFIGGKVFDKFAPIVIWAFASLGGLIISKGFM